MQNKRYFILCVLRDMATVAYDVSPDLSVCLCLSLITNESWG